MSGATSAHGETLVLASDASKLEIPMQLFALSGKRLVEQPAEHDTGRTLRARVADELGVALECVKLLHGCSFVSDEALLAGLGSGHLQVVVDRFKMLEQMLQGFWKEVVDRQTATMPSSGLPGDDAKFWAACGLSNRTNAADDAKFWAAFDIQTGEELSFVVSSIMQTAMKRPHLIQTCIEAAATLHLRALEFPSVKDESKPLTVFRELLIMCQEQFEGLAPPRQCQVETRPLMIFLCNFFVQQPLLCYLFVDMVLNDLIATPTERELIRARFVMLSRSAKAGWNTKQIQNQIAEIIFWITYDNLLEDYYWGSEDPRFLLMGWGFQGRG